MSKKINKYKEKLLAYKPFGIFPQTLLYYFNIPIGKPDSISFEVTHRCNSRCKTCYYWKNKSRSGEMRFEQWKSTILKVKDWLGNFELIISGGEPLVRKKDTISLIKFLSDNKIKNLLCTNALLLDKNTINQLINAGLKNISISLNSLNEKKHDDTRGTKGSYKKAINAINCFHNRGVLVSIDSIIFPQDLDEVIPLLEWTRKQRYDSIFFNMLHPIKNDNLNKGKNIKSNLDYAKMNLILKTIKKMKLNGYPLSNSIKNIKQITRSIESNQNFNLKCLCGVRRFAILPNGNVKLCARKDPVGNILKDDPKRIWFSKKAIRVRQEIKICDLNCDLTGGLSCNTRKNLLVDGYSLVRRHLVLQDLFTLVR